MGKVKNEISKRKLDFRDVGNEISKRKLDFREVGNEISKRESGKRNKIIE